MIKNDKWIIDMAERYKIIDPFEKEKIRDGVISYGISSYGYDIRIADEFKILNKDVNVVIDPKNFDSRIMQEIKTNVCEIPPNSYILARSYEYFKIPRNVLTLCLGKSTYARCGIIVNVTPLEPEWEGYITMGISNTSPLPVRIYANEGIAQVLFFESDEPPLNSYKDVKGKYQAQGEVTYAKV